MIHSSARRVLTLLLAVFVTVSLNLSSLQASSMASEMAKMTAMSDMDSSMSGDCQKCPSMRDGAAMPAMCSAVCVPPAMATILPEAAETFAFAQNAFLTLGRLISRPA